MIAEVFRATQVRRDTTGSVLAGLIAQTTLVVSGVLSARILGVVDRGNLALILLFPVALAQLGSLGLPLSVTYFIAKNREQARGVLRSVAGIAVAQAIILVILHASIIKVLFMQRSEDFVQASLIALAIIPVSLAYEFGLATLQGMGRFRPFNVIRLILPLFYSTGVLVLYLSGEGSLVNVTVVYVFATAITGMFSIVVTILRLPSHESGTTTVTRKELVDFGYRALLGSISPVESLKIDQAVVGLYLSPAALGLYVVGKGFTNLPRFIASSIGKVAYPYVARQNDARNARKAVWRFFWLVIVLSILVIGALQIGADWLVRFFFGEEFAGAVWITRILLINSLFVGVRVVLADGVRGAGRPTLGTIAEIVSWLVLLPALAVMTPLWGAAGSASGLSLSSATSLVALLVLVNVPRKDTADKARTSNRGLR